MLLELGEVAERLPARRTGRPQRRAHVELPAVKRVSDLLDRHALDAIAADRDSPRIMYCSDRRRPEVSRRNCPSVAHLVTSAPQGSQSQHDTCSSANAVQMMTRSTRI